MSDSLGKGVLVLELAKVRGCKSLFSIDRSNLKVFFLMSLKFYFLPKFINVV